ncbi:endonuclease/exonuclease/phosphatase family protein [Rhodohalobacter sp. 614A]|uniref:endonuclease/exonuclease/phosphatase family protein n=1 Tax=Rhodohalobacter sp. 614A TaxID=2908649 RepID=UPI001F38729E|nr:endonuclease/exonuclease/phosphatase family protein [Rhodohalobacter sp. 614A]
MTQKRSCSQAILLKNVLLICISLFCVESVAAQIVDASIRDIPKDSTFDVVTWNIEWFGSETNGPEDIELQMNNVIEVVKTMDADLYAFQEIVDKLLFFALDDSLENYNGFYASYAQSQKTAYLFKTSVIDSLDSGLLKAQQNEDNWAGGRFPLFFEFDVTLANQTLRVFSYNLHAKAFSDQNAYNQRRNAANSLKEYLDRSRYNASVIVLGDFNDMLTTSTFDERESPYSVFVEDNDYLKVTLPLEEQGFETYLPEEYNSFIDHIIVTNVLKNIHMHGEQMVASTDYIENFESTTSDHAPVWTRFDFTKNFEDRYEELPEEFLVGPNYPNPFNPSTTIPFELNELAEVSAAVYDIMGREIAVLSNDQPFNAGEHTLTFNAAGLTSGIYLFRLELSTGQTRTQKMTLIK